MGDTGVRGRQRGEWGERGQGVDDTWELYDDPHSPAVAFIRGEGVG